MLRSNKTHTMILACATGDFQKSQKMRYFQKCINNLPKAKFQVFDVFASRIDQFLPPALQFDKTCTENTFFF